jgi:hypothetical protein
MACWLGGNIMRGGGFGFFGNLIVGMAGAFLGGFLLNALGIDPRTYFETQVRRRFLPMNNKAVQKDPTTQRESFTELLGQIANSSGAVIHDEIDLVIQGIREKMTAVRSGILTVAIGAVISFAAFMSFCAALIIELTSYMTPVLATLVAGAALALIGVVIVFIGYMLLKRSIRKT